MDIATGAIGSILSKLADLLKSEYMRQTGVKDRAESLTKELQHVYAFLQKVAKVPPDQLDEQVKVWASEVREASYDMEDILDTFLVHADSPAEPISKKRKLFEMLQEKIGSFFSKAKARHDISTAIEQVNNKVREIAERRQRYRLDDCVVSVATPSSQIDPRIALVHRTNTSLLVGIDERKDIVIKMVSQDGAMSAKKTKIVSLLGFGGVGKTTLAKAAYDQLKQQYLCVAFVSVGRNPEFLKVFKDILCDLDKDKFSDIHSTQKGAGLLIRELLAFLEDKRYLIVIDDVWETQSRKTIMEALPDNGENRIILTTRNSKVATGEVYKVQPLSDDNSRRLFFRRIFGGEHSCTNNQQRVSEVAYKILRRCGGVPLAIITMASLLVGKSMQEWIEVCNSIGFGDKYKEELDDTTWILSLSYYDLPSHLKTCFLYLSIFPEDYLIKKDTLIWMWVAESFVNRKPGIGLFEIGEGYFNDLINRNLIEPVEEKTTRIIKGCRIHDMIFDLIRSLSHEAKFVGILDKGEESLLLGSNARRLALQNKLVVDAPLDNLTVKSRTRSFMAFGCSFSSWGLLQNFKLLRVLYLEGCHCIPFDEHVGDLVHLRCLGIHNACILELPKEIGALKFLRVLYLEDNDKRGLLPSSLGMLTQLICLRAFCMSLSGETIRELTSLQELHIYPGEDEKSIGQFVKDVGNLRELRELKINIRRMDERTQSDLWKSLANLHKMQRLELLHGAEWNGGPPSCIDPSGLSSLSSLSLTVFSLSDTSLRILGGLPELCYLEVSTYHGQATVTGTVAHGYFQKLRRFSLPRSVVQFVVNEDDPGVSFTMWDGTHDHAPAFGSQRMQGNIGRVRVQQVVMPNLEELYFRLHVRELTACNNASSGNLGLNCLASLQKIRVDLRCWGARIDVVEKEEAALRRTIQIHPNRPTLEIVFFSKPDVNSPSDDADDDVGQEGEEVLSLGDEDVTQPTRSDHEE